MDQLLEQARTIYEGEIVRLPQPTNKHAPFSVLRIH